ncbi:hypothetical protein GCM10009634_63150 [Saccharothrix xinjiangensis]
MVTTRPERQEVLFRQRAARAGFVLSESCLRRVVGGEEVMREQWAHPGSVTRRRNVRIRSAGTRPPGPRGARGRA